MSCGKTPAGYRTQSKSRLTAFVPEAGNIFALKESGL